VASSQATSVRVPEDYFGVNFQNAYWLSAEVRDRHLSSMASAGVTQVRLPVPWELIEPRPPNAAGHRYRWDAVDSQIAALAGHGLRAQVMLAYAPGWASSATPEERRSCRRHGAAGLGAGSPRSYAKAAAALARRYGPGGGFWNAHRPRGRRPVRVYEIWNSPNTAGAWCPRVDPGGYAVMFVLAAKGIRHEQRHARVVVGGIGPGARTQGGSVAPDEFLIRMVATDPSVIRLATAVGVHAYPWKNPDQQLYWFPRLRQWIRDAGFPDSTPMLVDEIGFSRAGSIDYTEPERVAAYANVMSKLPRTNCNISGVIPYTWATREQSAHNAEDWFGIASPATGRLYPSGRKFVSWANRFRGRLHAQAPRRTLMVCPGMPLPDQDRDGVPDEEDRFPLGPAGGPSGGGSRRACTMVGTPGADVLIGGRGRDVICPRQGADVVRGRGGSDIVRGGRGSDLIRGGVGRDRLYGGEGGDALSGGRGRDFLHGGGGVDVLRGGRGRDLRRQ
jgi:hypothetical protein